MGSLYLFKYFKIYFWLLRATREILVSQPRIELMPPAVEAQSLNYWTIREVSIYFLIKFLYYFKG